MDFSHRTLAVCGAERDLTLVVNEFAWNYGIRAWFRCLKSTRCPFSLPFAWIFNDGSPGMLMKVWNARMLFTWRSRHETRAVFYCAAAV